MAIKALGPWKPNALLAIIRSRVLMPSTIPFLVHSPTYAGTPSKYLRIVFASFTKEAR